MSEKGFIVLHELIKVGHSNMIDQIVLGRDKNVQNDFEARDCSMRLFQPKNN